MLGLPALVWAILSITGTKQLIPHISNWTFPFSCSVASPAVVQVAAMGAAMHGAPPAMRLSTGLGFGCWQCAQRAVEQRWRALGQSIVC